MTEPDLRLARPDVGTDELAAVAAVLESGQLTMGPQVAAFERAIADAVGTADAVAVSTGTAALHLAVLALGIGPGDEVIVPAYTFPATANAVELCGARAVLVDIDPETFLVRPELVAEAVTPRTRAVLAVHLFGRPVAWEELQTAVPQEVALVEDAAGALGARYRGTPCGALGLIGCLSFHPRKIVTTGEGGAVTTDEAELAAAVRRLRHHGIAAGSPVDIPAPGFNYRLPDVLCALGIPQLARLESLLQARERVAGWYSERLAHLVGTPTADEGDRHGWQAYVVSLDRRDEALAGLREQGIEAQIGTYAVNRLSAYRDRGSFPGADAAFERALALPFATTMSEDDVERVCSAPRALRLGRRSVPGEPGDLHDEREPRVADLPLDPPAADGREHEPGRLEPPLPVPRRDVRLERRRRRVESPSRDPQPARRSAPPAELRVDRAVVLDRRPRPAPGEDARGEVPFRPPELNAEPGGPVVERRGGRHRPRAGDSRGHRPGALGRSRRCRLSRPARLRCRAPLRAAGGAALAVRRATRHAVTTPTAVSRFPGRRLVARFRRT